jgi:hypothetical protein
MNKNNTYFDNHDYITKWFILQDTLECIYVILPILWYNCNLTDSDQ